MTGSLLEGGFCDGDDASAESGHGRVRPPQKIGDPMLSLPRKRDPGFVYGSVTAWGTATWKDLQGA